MKIVMSGYAGFDNVGDEAILLAMVQALRDIEPDADITVLSNNPEQTEKLYGVKAVNRWKLKEVFKALRSSDGLISGGGSLLQDKTGSRSVIYYTGVMWLARLARKPVVIYAQGMGPLKEKRSRTLTKAALNRAGVITVRDNDSRNLLKEIGVKKEVEVVPDPVMGLSTKTGAAADWRSENVKSDSYIVAALRDWPEGKNHLEKIADSLTALVQKGNQIVMLPMHGEEDYKTAQSVIGMMDTSDAEHNPVIFPYDSTIEEKADLTAEAEFLIGMRLHALIFSAVSGRPFVALSYDPKIDAFAALCSQPVAADVEKEDWTGADVTDAAENMITSMPDFEQKVVAYSDEARQKAAATMRKACDYFRKSRT